MKKHFTPARIMALLVMPMQTDTAGSNNTVSYMIGAIIALLLMGYLIYTLLHPDKF